ncbi:MAG: L,D-transpeptidase [Actinobacteria bacterium]|nr:L,D-transpeptidase [Actinomycetota bacterium]
MPRRLVIAFVATGIVSGLLAAFVMQPSFRRSLPSVLGGGDARSASAAPDPFEHVVAKAVGSQVPVYEDPALGGARKFELPNPTEDGAPLIFLVQDQKPGWYYVILPVRPNGSVGWIRADDVTTSKHYYRIEVDLTAHRITVKHRDGVFLEEKIGVGRGPTPTPIGVFYTKELLRPPNPDTAYGAYAYGLSGYSNVLTDFAGGDGVVGIHGTNDPSTLGTDVSHGCIRLSNEAITRLAKYLPLGVPVIIKP